VLVNEPAGRNRALRRAAVVALLLIAAFFAAGPWLGCIVPLPFLQTDLFLLRVCTFGDRALRSGPGLPGFAGPYWGNLVFGIAYIGAAVFAAFTKRWL
jgi:hypothetical protein